MPPFGRGDALHSDARARPTAALDLRHAPEPARRERLLELARDRVVWVEVRVERGPEPAAVLVPLCLAGDGAGWWGSTVDIIDIEIDQADFWRDADDVARFGGHADDPWTGVFEEDLRITRMHSGEGDPAPATELDEVFNGGDCDAEHCRMLGHEEDTTRRGEGNLADGEDVLEAEAGE